MIIRTEDLKKICSTILQAVDTSELSAITETLELKTVGSYLYMNVTNREYYASVKLNIYDDIEFKATVNANLFLKLISQVTSETVEFNINDTNLNIKANGNYKLPLIFNGDTLLELPVIEINNKTANFDIPGEVLSSILKYNAKEINKEDSSKLKPIQRMYYIDEQGCVTFTSGACVNKFNLPQPVRILINSKLVKLFKLFKNEPVNFTLGYDPISEEIIQTKVKFETKDVVITSILSCDDALINSMPVEAIRKRAYNDYKYNISFNREEMLQAINRLTLFDTGSSSKVFCYIEFFNDKLVAYDFAKNSSEEIYYDNDIDIDEKYSTYLNINDFRASLDGTSDQHVTLKFGDHAAMVVTKSGVNIVIPECTQG